MAPKNESDYESMWRNESRKQNLEIKKNDPKENKKIKGGEKGKKEY